MNTFKHLIYTSVVVLLLMSCNNENNTASKNKELLSEVTKTIVSTEKSPLLKDIIYTLKVGKVNVEIEAGLHKDSSVALKFNFYSPFTFEEHLNYQNVLMQALTEDFQTNKVKSIFLGRLIYTGDLALETSKIVVEENWNGSSYPILQSILDTSAIINKYRPFFNEFEIYLTKPIFEKAFYTENTTIDDFSKTTWPKEEYPPKLLDAMIWVITY